MVQTLTVNCPICQKQVAWLPESCYRPFCSVRCQQIDLGAWADESYHLSSENSAEEQE